MQAIRQCSSNHKRLPLTRRPAAQRARAAAPVRGVTTANAAANAASSTSSGRLVGARLRNSGGYVAYSAEIEIETLHGISLHDLTPLVKQAVRESGVADGTVVVLSRHTTLSVTINEFEARLVDDTRQYLSQLAPASHPYLHNDLHLRSGPSDWPGGDETWRAQEPRNAHSHLQQMLLGASASVPVVGGELALGTWQSVIGVELDGSRVRRWSVAVQGLAAD